MVEILKSRNISIDFLRFIGLSLIILAHIRPPELLFQLRVFDVPLMLFVSGMAFSGREPDFSLRFFVKRIKRLVIPVYIFLTVYFTAVFMVQQAGVDLGIKIHHIIFSYLLIDGIGYVWVIRIFLIVMFLTPFLLMIDRKVSYNSLLWLTMATILIIDDLFIANKVGMGFLFIREFIYYGVGYGLIFFLGLRYNHFSKNLKILVFAIAVLGYVGLQFIEWHHSVGGVISIQSFKYPPRALFLLYGTAMSFSVVAIAKLLVHQVHIPKWILFIGQNTIWIYLYHIPMIQLTEIMHLPWFVNYLAVYIVSVFIVYGQNLIVCKYSIPYSAYFIG